MSLELSVYCDRSKLPTAQQWSAAIKKDGFDLTFIDGLNWKKPHGAVKLNGDETDFELSLFPNDGEDEPPKPAIKFDSLVAFRFGSTGGVRIHPRAHPRRGDRRAQGRRPLGRARQAAGDR